MRRIRYSLTGAIALSAAALAWSAAPVNAQVPWESASFHAYATGTVVHADLLQASSSGPQVVNAEVAFSGASVASKGTGTDGAPAQIVNEMGQIVQPKLPAGGKLAGNRSFGRRVIGA